VAIGLLRTVAGALLWSGVGRGWLGRLPGDIHYTKGDAGFYFPLTTCILISLLLTAILRLLRKF
jgi:hypothetical protein